MSNDLVTFVRARLDEDERVARAAQADAGGDWSAGDECLGEAVGSERQNYILTGPYGGGLSWELRQHTARHDPARVLREVEAKRAVVAMAAKVDSYRSFLAGASLDEAEAISGQQVMTDVLQALAAAWSDHPDYQAEWAP